MMAAVESLRRRKAREIVAAVPCASEIALSQLERVVDRVIAAEIGTGINFAVADYYRYWYDISDEETLRLIKDWRMHHPRNGTLFRDYE